MGLDLVSFLENTNKQYGLTRPPIKKKEIEKEEKETILDTFPEPFDDDHEEKLLKEKDQIKREELMIISKREKEE